MTLPEFPAVEEPKARVITDEALRINEIGNYLLHTLVPTAGWSLVPNIKLIGKAAWGEFIEKVEASRGKERTEYDEKAYAIPDQLFAHSQTWSFVESNDQYSLDDKAREKKAIVKGIRKVGKELLKLFESGLVKHAFRTEVHVQGQEVTFEFVDLKLNEEEILGNWEKFISSAFPSASKKV